MRPRARFLLGLLAVVGFLTIAPQVRAEAGQDATPAAVPAESGTPEDANAATEAKDEPAETKDDGAKGASESENAGAGSAGGDEALAGEPAAEKPGAEPQPAQGTGAVDPDAAAAGVDQSASVAQAAGGDAAAEQQDVGNVAVTVRVDEPGSGTPVGQENRAAADARSAANAVVDAPGEADVDQHAHANAGAAQAGVTNTAVVVRVGSAGDDAGVSQANVAAGAAAASASDVASSRANDASAVVTQDDVANTSVSVRVFSPGDDGPVTQLNVAAAEAHAGHGAESAAASQNGVRNTAVSIRVESPGSSAAATQESRSDAVASVSEGEDAAGAVDGAAVAVTNDAVNTVLTVAVGGPTLDRPGRSGLQVWVWTWVWERDESESVDDVVEAAVGSWSWDWATGGTGATPPHGSVTSRSAGGGDPRTAGSWEWAWEWDRDGVASWSWNWSWATQLPCSSCVWIWNWSWTWTGTPAGAAAAAGPVDPAEAPAPGQLNAAEAKASASASARVAQSVFQEATGDGTQLAGQLASVVQDVHAVATARQEDVVSVAWGIDRPAESNVARSDAVAAVSGAVTQHAVQAVAVREGASADQWAGQQGDLAQLGRAQAEATQRDLLLETTGSHTATSAAVAHGETGVDQGVLQDALAGGGTLSQWIGQLALVEQAVDAGASVVQAGGPRSSRRGGGAVASALADDLALVTQSAEQTAARMGGIGAQSIWQLALVWQHASAQASTTQRAGTAPAPTAASGAESLNRAAVDQEAWQAALGSAAVDLQDIVQESVVVQTATATSTSRGGLAGVASVFNCAVTYQGATQSLGAGSLRSSSGGLGSFCIPTPAAEPPISSPVVPPFPTAPGGAAPSLDASPVVAAGDAVELPQPAGAEQRPAAAAGPTTARRAAPGRAAPPAHGPARLSSERSGVNQISVPHSTQARIGTRPGSRAGSGDAGRESPLPPAGDPPSRVFVPAAGASGAGSSGIAAILFAFALVPPSLLRAPEGSVVRRPTGVLARSDVPI